MRITISARKTTVRDSFKERVERKLTKLDRFFDDDALAIVTVTNEGDRETVEVTIQSGGYFYRAEKTTSDRVESLEIVVDSLFKQIVKNKEKLKQRFRRNVFDDAGEMFDYEQSNYQVV
ncbi:MAG: ribosome-associated translation inhibitor RaiA, partial [Oscillospiraceae bacterium]